MRVAIAAALLVLVAGCGSGEPTAAPSVSTTAPTTTTSAVPLLEKWESAMRAASTRDRCSTEKALTTSCAAAMENLDKVAMDLAESAPRDGIYTDAALVAISASRAASKWVSCINLPPADRLRIGCLQALNEANGGAEAVIAELYEIKLSR